MRRTWQARRAWLEDPDGQRRWDRAYQLLLRWTMAANQPPKEEEGSDASSVLRAGLDGAAAARADD
jgi:hypothetical protein